MGDVGPDGKFFRGYIHKIKKNTDNFYEIWEDEKTFFANKTKRKLNHRVVNQTPRGRAAHMLGNCRGSAKTRNITFDLRLEDILPAVESRVCQLTGLPFDFSPNKKKGLNPYAPSVDRIDNERGYTKDNVRVVLWAVNAALNECSDEEARPIIKALGRALEKNAKQNTTTPVPAGLNCQGELYPELGTFSAPWTGEDDDNAHHHCGTISGEDLDHRAQASSGDGVGHRGQEVVAPVPLTRVQDYGDAYTEVVRFEFGSGRIPD
jgi:hypothetical protein